MPERIEARVKVRASVKVRVRVRARVRKDVELLWENWDTQGCEHGV